MNSFSLQKHIEFLNNFMNKTSQYAMKGPQPGGYYKAIWMRDAAYILKDQFISGYTFDVIDDLIYIWSNQIIETQDKKIIFGRGSPITKGSKTSKMPKSWILFRWEWAARAFRWHLARRQQHH